MLKCPDPGTARRGKKYHQQLPVAAVVDLFQDGLYLPFRTSGE